MAEFTGVELELDRSESTPASSRRMTIFVLVHGSNVGGEVWRHVVPLLHDAGHEVFTPPSLASVIKPTA